MRTTLQTSEAPSQDPPPVLSVTRSPPRTTPATSPSQPRSPEEPTLAGNWPFHRGGLRPHSSVCAPARPFDYDLRLRGTAAAPVPTGERPRWPPIIARAPRNSCPHDSMPCAWRPRRPCSRESHACATRCARIGPSPAPCHRQSGRSLPACPDTSRNICPPAARGPDAPATRGFGPRSALEGPPPSPARQESVST